MSYHSLSAIKAELDMDDLVGHVLMYLPYAVAMEKPAQLDVLDTHRFRLKAPEGERYLACKKGEIALLMMGFSSQLPQPGETIDAGLYRVTVIDGDTTGITELEFTFDQPLDTPEYHFFFGSPQFAGYPLDMKTMIPGKS